MPPNRTPQRRPEGRRPAQASEEADFSTIHGLRGTGILVRFEAGNSVDQISNDIGRSRQMAERYMRFRDQMEVAERGRVKLTILGD